MFCIENLMMFPQLMLQLNFCVIFVLIHNLQLLTRLLTVDDDQRARSIPSLDFLVLEQLSLFIRQIAYPQYYYIRFLNFDLLKCKLPAICSDSRFGNLSRKGRQMTRKVRIQVKICKRENCSIIAGPYFHHLMS